MKSFRQFLEDINPIELIQRAGRRFGRNSRDVEETRTSSGEIKATPVKTRVIPLKYNKKAADELDDHLPWGESIKDKPIKKFEIKSLIPTQSKVRIDDVERLKQKAEDPSPTIHVATYKGQNFIIDGHHSAMMARARGEKHIKAYHTDLDN